MENYPNKVLNLRNEYGWIQPKDKGSTGQVEKGIYLLWKINILTFFDVWWIKSVDIFLYATLQY